MELYTYQPLLPSPSSIRLLRLLPGADETEIRCRISNHYLVPGRPFEEYEALSYVWGATNTTQRILIEVGDEEPGDGLDEELVYLEVTVNLHAALLHLRRPNSHRLLWVDAICINQKDLAEREQQVQIMGRIYSMAKTVVVWLGEEPDESSSDLTNVGASRQDDLGVPHQGTDEGWEELCAQQDWDGKLGSLSALAQRPWFRRIWVS
jgi:Heterokaryon incompatibility protein (HET)